ncbi:MAG TPA: hypothetical protein VJN92_18410 [Candidatus Acidoferrum sp.]|nr:hypothetical protein [Candidatus Acidoferrum sp.]
MNASEALPVGDTFLAVKPPSFWERVKPAILVVAGLLLWLPILRLNYLRALRWAGVMNAEASGYMLGGCLTSLLVGLLTMFVVAKIRGKKSAPPTRFFGVSVVGFLISFLSFMGSLNAPPDKTQRNIAELLRQAAGKKPTTADANWSDGPMRDFFRELLDRNQQYIAEVHALDSSAIKNLYSADSYAGKAHMEKVMSQLRAAYDVDQKYSSIEPVLKIVRDRVAVAHASEREKQDFLKGMDESLDRSLRPRTELLRTEKLWMDSTLDLYGFMLAHSSDYSIQDTKLYFADSAIRKQFTDLQSKAVASHKGFLKAKAALEAARKDNLNRLGVSMSEFTPSQLGKAH